MKGKLLNDINEMFSEDTNEAGRHFEAF